MKNLLDKIVWIGLFLLFIPTTLVIVSWNSLPGNFLYPVKLGLEKSLLVIVSPSYEVSGQLQIKYTERRFADAQRLLADKNSVTGLPYLDKQVEEAKVAIENAPNPEARQALTNQYINTLNQVFDGLEQQKMSLTQTPPSNFPSQTQPETPTSNFSVTNPQPSPTAGITQMPSVAPSQGAVITSVPSSLPLNTVPTAVPTPTPTTIPTLTTVVSTTESVPPPPANIVVAMQITESQQKISDAIDDLEKNNNQDKKDKKEPQNDNHDQNPKKLDSHESTPTPENQ